MNAADRRRARKLARQRTREVVAIRRALATGGRSPRLPMQLSEPGGELREPAARTQPPVTA